MKNELFSGADSELSPGEQHRRSGWDAKFACSGSKTQFHSLLVHMSVWGSWHIQRQSQRILNNQEGQETILLIKPVLSIEQSWQDSCQSSWSRYKGSGHQELTTSFRRWPALAPEHLFPQLYCHCIRLRLYRNTIITATLTHLYSMQYSNILYLSWMQYCKVYSHKETRV